MDEPDPTGAGTGEHSGGDGSGKSGGTAGTGGDDPPAIEVAGPTLENDYPEYWGNIYPGQVSKCANFTNGLEYDVTIESVEVSAPLVVTPGCAPDSGEPAATGCGPGVTLAAARQTQCTVGVRFADDADLARNHLPRNAWRLSVVCSDARAVPCSAPEVASRQPSEAAPVTVTWTMVEPMRFCGGTGYADDAGNPDGEGYPPESGCTSAAGGN